MKDYKKIEDLCHENSRMFSSVVENFLLQQIDTRENLGRKAGKLMSRYKHVLRKLPDGTAELFATQFIVHQVFREGGLIKKYLGHGALKNLKKDEKDFLVQQASWPWKWSFSMITGNPSADFYMMEDVFTAETFLLYSPGVTKILHTQGAILWFNLIGWNGKCWQSYGPIMAYQGFGPDDIFFFATELNPHKWMESGEDLMADVGQDPFPYMMLWSGSGYPLTFHKKDQIVQVFAEYDLISFDPKKHEKYFKIDNSKGVYRLRLKRWDNHPHFATAWYDEKKKVLSLHALSDRGFGSIISALNNCGHNFPDGPDIRVSIPMVSTAEDILQKKIKFNDYESLFPEETTGENNEEIEKINNMLAMALPEINAGKEPDIEVLARKAGVDAVTAKEIVGQVMNKLKGKGFTGE